MQSRTRTTWIAAAAAGVLWLASGLLNVLAASNVYVGRVLRLLVPSPTNALFWSWPAPWSFLTLLLAAATVATLVFLFTTLASRPGAIFSGAWLSTVAAGAITGLALDAIMVLSSVPVVGWRGLSTATIEFAVIGAYWGLVQGWIPALIASRSREGDAAAPAPRRRITWIVAAGAALGLLLVAGVAGAEANRRAIVQEQAIAEGFTPDKGAAPDPAAPGTPPATVAPTTVRRDPSWCTSEQAMLLLGTQDAATGHRVLGIRLMNFSDAPCVVEGYPDIAFADQNGHELDVEIGRGSSFMAQDAGPQPIEIPAGGYAIASIGWDANSTQGALVARTLFAAQVAGDDRGSWPVELDVVEGSGVELTAWQLDGVGPVAE
ncbi:DUF4232 domain-containing protein [Microbacterium sp. B2969]|uniref:DUF4232 domain-containing protein n=1 Tax=Microbacterium alkaliflavum TaxID=3248839 RepID=A0ABW7Q2M1_9MICO